MSCGVVCAQDEFSPIPIAEITRETPVDFAKEIYPLLKKNCIACHNSSKAKAKLNLETPASMIKGGSEGPSIVPGKADDSLLLLLASHQEDPVMPPEKNSSNAVPFTSEELGLIKLWIDEGAKGESTVIAATPETWLQPKRSDYPVYHVALSPDDRTVAASRGNRVFLYDLYGSSGVTELADPHLKDLELYQNQQVAHRDFVQSMGFSPQGWLATGGFRNVKIWRPNGLERESRFTMPEAITALASTPDGVWAASGDAAGHVRWWKPNEPAFTPNQAKRHEGKITSLAFTQDGSQLISGSADGTFKVYALESGEQLHQRPHQEPILSVVALPGFHVATAGEKGQVFLWDFQSEEPNELANHGQPVRALAIVSGETPKLFSAGDDGFVRLLSLPDGTEERRIEHGEPVVSMSVSADGQRLATLSAKTGKLWNVSDGKLVKAFATHFPAQRHQLLAQRQLNALAKLVEARKKKVADTEKAWKDEIEKAKKASTDELAARNDQAAKQTTAHEKRLAAKRAQTAAKDAKKEVDSRKTVVGTAEAGLKSSGEALVKAQEASKEIGGLQTTLTSQMGKRQELAPHLASAVEEASALRDQKAGALTAVRQLRNVYQTQKSDSARVAVEATEDLLAEVQAALSTSEMKEREVKGQDTQLAGEIATLEASIAKLTKQLSEAESIQKTATTHLEESKKRVADAEAKEKQLSEALKKANEERDKAANELDAATKKWRQAVENGELAIRLTNRAAESQARAAAALVAAEAKQKAQQEAADAAKKALETPPVLTQIRFALDGRQIAIATAEHGLLTYQASDGEPVSGFKGAKLQALTSLANGAWLVGDAEKHVHRQATRPHWQHLLTLGAIDDPKQLIDRVTAVAFSPNGTLLATGSGSPSRSGELKIWRVADGELLVNLDEAHTDTIVGLEFSPDGRYIATASTDRFAKVFQVDDGERVASFEGHTSHVLDVSWRADGLVLATSGADNVIKLWDFEEQRQIKTINGYNKEITSVAFLDNAETLVTSSGDHSIRLGNDRLDNKDFVYATALSRDGQRVIAGSQDSVVRVWDTKEKKLLMSFEAPKS